MNSESEILKHIKELEKQAKILLKEKNSVIPRRPMVIEFCGAPKSGKTSSINSLDLFLRRNGFRTTVLTERASVCPVKNKYDPFFNIWTVTSAIAELSEILSNHAKEYDVVILDRGIFDALCWFTWLLNRKNLDKSNYDSIVSFLTMNKWRSAIDLIYVFTVSPSKSLEREFTGLLTRKTGRIMDPDVLASYLEGIEITKTKFDKIFKQIVEKNTDNKDLNRVNYEVTKDILSKLNDIVSEKIAYFDASLLKDIEDTHFKCSKLKNIDISLSYDVRKKVESDKNLIQPIPILVITNKERTHVLVVKKNIKQAPKSSPESNRILLYFGGHIREEDKIDCPDKDWFSVSRYALHREIKEELNFDYYADNQETPLCIWDKSNDRSLKHLALCHVIEVNFNILKFKLDHNEFITKGNTKSGKVLDLSEVKEMYEKLEPWSKVIMHKVFNFSPSSEQVDFINKN